jgi:outer membrane protein OmpA-like peptidoglycan-associated protein
MKNTLALLFCFFIYLTPIWSQSPAKIKRQAEHFFEEKQYEKSLNEYNKIKDKYLEDALLHYNMGASFFELHDYPQSIQHLQNHLQYARKTAPLSHYYLARAYHLQDSFLTAAQCYKQHLRTLSKDAPERSTIKRFILQCLNGPKIQQINSRAIITGLGQEINSPADDYRICLNPQLPNSIFFSSKRPLNGRTAESNIYRANQEQGTFLPALPLQDRYNTALDETLLAFFDKGYQLLLLKELSDGSSQLLKDNFDEDSVEVLLPFANNLNAQAWDSEHFFVNDSMVIFASNRPGGFGASDLYFAVYQDSSWQAPVNLGSSINSPDDESGPFLAANGVQLFFNSNRTTGMGGHDIYQTFFDKNRLIFEPAENLGVPLNSSGDDKDFLLLDDQQRAYLSSNRAGGLGGLDLYAVYFRSNLIINKTKGSSFVELLAANQTALATTENNLPTNTTSDTPDNQPLGAPEKYTLAPLYYNANTGQLEGSRNSLKNLSQLLQKYPQLQVVLSAHSNQEGDPNTDLYLTVKQAESIAQQLLAAGANNQQLLLRGCSQNYPLASPQNFDGSPNPLAKTINQRVNITLYHQDQLPANVTVDLVEPRINSVMQSQKAARYQQQLQGLSYKVQLTQSPSLFQHAVLNQYSPISTEKRPQDTYVTYLVGLEKTFIDIKYTYNKLLEKGFDSVKIIPYINGWPIDKEEAARLVEEYPDLKVYLGG